MRRRAFFQLHLAVGLFGLAGLFGPWLKLEPLLIVQGRTAIAALSFLFIPGFLGALKRPWGTYLWRRALLGAVLAFHWLAFFKAIENTSMALALLSFSSFPFFTLILERIIHKQAIASRDLFLIALSLLGTILILPWQSTGTDWLGLWWGLAAGLSFALLTIGNRHYVKSNKAVLLAFHQNAFAALVLIPFSLNYSWDLELRQWALLILLATVFTALSHSLFVNALKVVKAKTAALIAALEPVYAILAAYFIFEESPQHLVIVGGLIIIGAGLLAQKIDQD